MGNNNFGVLIEKLRRDKKYSLAKAGKLAGLSDTYLCKLENGQRHNPTVYTLGKLSQAYGSNLEQLAIAALKDIVINQEE